ncbi:NAD(P)/FAD-dependent oxidoreductase [Sporichthya brevicatena]|uniref:NAD(P)/FAD-dependent oxidoreductase n=1 Tax=Sporichthya brevicatena TaxID=171442 RepID=UPI0031D15A78
MGESIERTVVVVGAGQAGCQAASSLRQDGFVGRLILVGAESHLPYQRPPLSKGHLTRTAPRDSLWFRPHAWYRDNDVELHLGRTIDAIDRTGRTIHCGEQRINYDVLVLALGARNRALDVPGAGLEGVLSLRSLDDADALLKRLDTADDIVIVGGGFIGLEVAATAAALGKRTTVLEVSERLMGRAVSNGTAEFLLQAHRSRGLTIELGTTVVELVGRGGAVEAVLTSDGGRIPAQLVLVGIGAAPETHLAAEAGLEIDNGIAVDEYLRTSDPDIYAIGDCVSCPNPYAGGARIRLESVQNAVSQGRLVAAAILGHPAPYDAVPWFWSDQADIKLQIAGLSLGHTEVVIKGDVAARRFSTYCFAGERLIGVESVNSPGDHLAARRLISAAETVSPAEVRADGFNPKVAARKH